MIGHNNIIRLLTPTWVVIFYCCLDAAIAMSKSTMSVVAELEEEPNPPVWPKSVKIIRDSQDKEEIMGTIGKTQDPWNEENKTFTSDFHFSNRRYALLFAPGVYRGIDFEVGYYVQVAGLGRTPESVEFADCERGPYVPALNRHLHPHRHGTCLDTFWRSGENFFTRASEGMRWAVSQAAPLRRVRVSGDLHLHDGAAFASGGHLANAKVDGHTHAGAQQQFFMRNVELGQGASGGAWSMVYAGCSHRVPASSLGTATSPSITVIDRPRVRIEKPYVALKDDGVRFELRVPMPLYDATVGPLLDGSREEVRDFTSVRVVRADESPGRIQQALDSGMDVVLAPGIFQLNRTIVIRRPHQVLLGLGLATLVAPQDGTPCIKVSGGSPGVRVAGIMLEASERTLSAGAQKSGPSTLLEWGEEGVRDPGRKDSPGALFDIFCRVGGASYANRDKIAVDAMIRIHSGHVIGDNLWLWRADHGELGPGEEPNYPHISPIYWQSEQNEYRVGTGIEVLGDDVTMFGLAVEHSNGHQTVWSGERGAVHFYQCEFPYGVNRTFGEDGFRGYLVAPGVRDHEVYAPGVYSNFRNDSVIVATAMELPERSSARYVNPFTVKLDNYGAIRSVVNGKGGASDTQGTPARMTPSLLADADNQVIATK